MTFSSIAYPNLGIEEVFERAARMGLRYIELRVSEDGVHVDPRSADTRLLRGLVERTGVGIALLASYIWAREPGSPEGSLELSRLYRVASLAHDLGVDRVRVFAYYTGDIERSVEALERFLERASVFLEDLGVRALFETHDYFAEKENLRRLAEVLEVYRDSTGVLFDPANIMMRGQSYEEPLYLVAEMVYHVHIKDFTEKEGLYVYTRPGRGSLPICRIVRDIEALRAPEVFYSIEWEKIWRRDLEDPDLVLPEYIEFVRGCLS